MENNKSNIIIAIIIIIITGSVVFWIVKSLSNETTKLEEVHENSENNNENDYDNRIEAYKKSKINAFQIELRSIYRTAQTQFLTDSLLLNSNEKIVYSNECTNIDGINKVIQLDMTGSTKIKYYVLIDISGNILNIKATNGEFNYILAGSDIKIEDLDVENNNEVDLESSIISNFCEVVVK